MSNPLKPFAMAGTVVRRGGRQERNDFAQPEKFFIELKELLRQLNDVPLSAIEELTKYEEHRDTIIEILRKCQRILDAANIDVEKELERVYYDPFDGLEEDLEARKQRMAVDAQAKPTHSD